MTSHDPHNRRPTTFPMPRILLVLVGASIALTLLVAGGVYVFDPLAVRPGLAISLTVSLSMIAGLFAVAALWHRGPGPAVGGWLIGAALRFAVALGVLAWAVRVAEMPVVLAVFALMLTYLPLMMLEAAMIGKSLWYHAAAAGPDVKTSEVAP